MSESEIIPGAEELVSHLAFVRRLASGLVGDAHGGDDLAQDVALAVLTRRPAAVRSLPGWLAGVARNLAAKARRRESRRVRREETSPRPPPPETPVAQAARLEVTRRLVQAVMELPEPYRRAVVRRWFDERSAAEIAREEGVAQGTVRSRLSRALAMLRERLDAEHGGDRRAWMLPLLSFVPSLGRTSAGAIAAAAATKAVVATATAGGAVMGLKTVIAAATAAVLLLGAGLTWFELSGPAPDARPAAPPPTASAPAPDAPLPHLPPTNGPAPLADAPAATAPAPAGEPARSGEFSFHYGQGYSFARGAVVDSKEGDLVFQSCAGGITTVVFQAPGGEIGNLSVLSPEVSSKIHPGALLAALVRADPGKVALGDRSSGDSREGVSDVFLLHTRDGYWVKLAILSRSDSAGGWTEYPVRVRYVLNPEAPEFGEGSDTFEKAGLVVDRGVLAREDVKQKEEAEREQAIRAAPVLARLADLDCRALALEGGITSRDGKAVHVAAVLDRRYAAPLGGTGAYTAATYSFEKKTRDDREATRNDWDFVIQSGGKKLVFNLRTVTDDRSVIRDLGPVDFDTARRGEVPPGPGGERANVVKGHVYVIHTLDSETDQWALLEVLEATPGESLIFRWEVLDDPGRLRDVLVAPGAVLKSPYARLELRNGAGGGNPQQVFLDGTTNRRVDRIENEPLDVTGPIGTREESRAYVEGGYVPMGRVFRVESIEITARADGDSNGHGEFLLIVGGFPIAHIVEAPGKGGKAYRLFTIDGGSEMLSKDDFPVRRRISIRLFIRSGEEKDVYAEVANSSAADVVLRGLFQPEEEAPPPLDRSLGRGFRYRLDQVATGDDAEAAVRGLASLGDRVVPWLQVILATHPVGEYGRRLEDALTRLGR